MAFDNFYHKLHENIDTTNYVEKYKTFGQKLKEMFYISSHADSFVEIRMAAYFNKGILYKFYFKTINSSNTLKKILKIVRNKHFEIKPADANSSMTVVEVVYEFKDIDKILNQINSQPIEPAIKL